MRIQNAPHLSHESLLEEIHKGARFVHFPFVISLIFTTLKRESGAYLIRPNENKFAKALPYIIITAIFGWWAFPFGPRHTVHTLRAIFKGGKDVTEEVNDTVAGFLLYREAEQRKAS